MNRRQFAGNFISALAGFSILPGSTLYQRVWKSHPFVPYEDLYVCGDDGYFRHAKTLTETPSGYLLARRFIYSEPGKLNEHGFWRRSQNGIIASDWIQEDRWCVEDYNRRLALGKINGNGAD